MRRSEGAASVEIEARGFSYDSGATGPAAVRPIAVEAPVQIAIGGAPFAIMMATPQDLEDFAYGFALTEGIAQKVEDIRGVEIMAVEDGFKTALALTAEKLQAHLARKRADPTQRLQPTQSAGDSRVAWRDRCVPVAHFVAERVECAAPMRFDGLPVGQVGSHERFDIAERGPRAAIRGKTANGQLIGLQLRVRRCAPVSLTLPA